MQKIGLVEFREATDSKNAYISYYTDELLVTRLDLYEDYEEYDVLNTEHCFSSYFKDANEYYLGDDSYVQKVLKMINKISIMPGTQLRPEINIVDGIVEMVTEKVFEEKCGTTIEQYVLRQVLISGELKEQSYISPTISIKFTNITNSVDLAIRPVNFFMYEAYGDVLNFDNVMSYSSAEYYTEEELRMRYPGKLDHLDEYDMIVCDSLTQAIARLKELEESDTPRIAVDIESTGLEMGIFGQDVITGIVISFTETQSTYYPFRQEGCSYNLPIWFISEILRVYNSKGETRKSCTFNGKMEIESFWKERPAFVKNSDYANKWSSKLYYSMFLEEDNGYVPTQEEIEFVNKNKYAKLWLEDASKINDSEVMTVFMNDDGLHTSIKLDQRRGRGIHKLKTISERLTGKFWLELDIIFKGLIRFNVLPANLIKLYACPDTMNTIRVCRILGEEFPKSELAVLELENLVTYVKAENEFYGLPMHEKKLDSLILEDTYAKDILEKKFREAHRTSKNIRSNTVKADIFYNQLKASILLRTKTGAPSASNQALGAIIDDGTIPKDQIKSIDIPDIAIFTKRDGTVCSYDRLTEEEKAIVEDETQKKVKNDEKQIKVRTILAGQKLAGNRYPSLLILSEFNKLAKELGALNRLRKKSRNNRFQFYIISDGADSDRQTSDAHQFSDTMKQCVVADSKHHRLISCDYKQVELRVLAFLANEVELMEMQKDPGIDIHRAIIQLITGVPMWKISASLRKLRKQVNFGVVYGMTEFGLAVRLFGIKYSQEQLLECMKMILDFYNGLPGVKAFKNESETKVMEKGKIETAFGFIRYFKNILDPSATKKDISKAKKAANNTRVQGFAATLMKKAEVLYYQHIREKGWDKLVDCDGVMLPLVRLMLSIHDELLISAHESIPIEEIIEMCKICQEIPIKGAPPFFAAPAFVDCWYDGKNDAYEIPIPLRDKIIEEYKKGNSLIKYETYLEDLNSYRKSELYKYMDALVAEYKTPEAVAEHVRHPELTHTLISAYIEDEDKISDHIESIRVAVERYMEGREMDVRSMVGEVSEEVEYMDESVNIGQYMFLDANGEQIIEYADDDTREEFETEDEDDMSTLIQIKPEFVKKMEPEYVFYGGRECMIDMSSFYREYYKEDIHNAIVNVALKYPGKYELYYIISGKMVKVGYKVNYVMDEFNFAIKEAFLNATKGVAV